MSECNIYISSDINTFFLYLDTWCNTLLKEKDDKKDDVDDARGTIIEGIQHYINLHPHDGDEFLCRYLVSNRFCCDVSEANNAIAVLKQDDILKVTNNGLRIDNLYNSFSKMETPIHCFHLSFPYFTLYSSLYTILEQDHLLVDFSFSFSYYIDIEIWINVYLLSCFFLHWQLSILRISPVSTFMSSFTPTFLTNSHDYFRIGMEM